MSGWSTKVARLGQGCNCPRRLPLTLHLQRPGPWHKFHTCNKRDDLTLSCVCRWSTEVAGLGPDARLLRYAKSHLHALWATPLPFLPDGALLLSGTLGAMLPWGPGWHRRPTTISDRFWLGGVGTVRGFRVRGLGPTAARRVDPDEVRAARGPKADVRLWLMPCRKLAGTTQWFCVRGPGPAARQQQSPGEVQAVGGTLCWSGGAACLAGACGDLLLWGWALPDEWGGGQRLASAGRLHALHPSAA